MQWLATISKCSLDWQELPNDYLNLTTQRSYTLDEVRDLINRHLNARGFTSIQSGEVLSVFKIDKLDPSVVRRVNEEELYDLKPYDFVKVSFELPAAMEVDKAKDDVKQVLSPNAKDVSAGDHEAAAGDGFGRQPAHGQRAVEPRAHGSRRPDRAQGVRAQARPAGAGHRNPVRHARHRPEGEADANRSAAMQQQMQMMQQMQQQGQDPCQSDAQKADAPKVYLAYNRQRNSVLANAPPEQMKIIEQTIAYLDVPFGGDVGRDVRRRHH